MPARMVRTILNGNRISSVKKASPKKIGTPANGKQEKLRIRVGTKTVVLGKGMESLANSMTKDSRRRMAFARSVKNQRPILITRLV